MLCCAVVWCGVVWCGVVRCCVGPVHSLQCWPAPQRPYCPESRRARWRLCEGRSKAWRTTLQRAAQADNQLSSQRQAGINERRLAGASGESGVDVRQQASEWSGGQRDDSVICDGSNRRQVSEPNLSPLLHFACWATLRLASSASTLQPCDPVAVCDCVLPPPSAAALHYRANKHVKYNQVASVRDHEE